MLFLQRQLDSVNMKEQSLEAVCIALDGLFAINYKMCKNGEKWKLDLKGNPKYFRKVAKFHTIVIL